MPPKLLYHSPFLSKMGKENKIKASWVKTGSLVKKRKGLHIEAKENKIIYSLLPFSRVCPGKEGLSVCNGCIVRPKSASSLSSPSLSFCC